MPITSLSELKAIIKSAVGTELSRRDNASVFGVVRETELKHIYEDVYDVYSPTYYNRRYGSGLGSLANIIGSNDDTMLSIRNITPPAPSVRGGSTSRFLAEIVEYGLAPNLWGDFPTVWSSPRRFTANTKAELASSGAIGQAMKSGLISQGFNVK